MSEYWIHEDGSVDFADGDIGDYNHEALVIEQVQRTIIDACEGVFGNLGAVSTWGGGHRRSASDDGVDWDTFKTNLSQAYAEKLIEQTPDKKEKIEKAIEYDPGKYLITALKECGVKVTEWGVAEGTSDARSYAMERWKWKTYRSGCIDTWRFTRDDLRIIMLGIESIADQEGWSDRKLNRTEFVIDVFANRKHISLTYAQMDRQWNKPAGSSLGDVDQFKSFDYLTQQAILQNRQQDLDQIHPAYKRPGVNPFGDSVLGSPTFSEWLKFNQVVFEESPEVIEAKKHY